MPSSGAVVLRISDKNRDAQLPSNPSPLASPNGELEAARAGVAGVCAVVALVGFSEGGGGEAGRPVTGAVRHGELEGEAGAGFERCQNVKGVDGEVRLGEVEVRAAAAVLDAPLLYGALPGAGQDHADRRRAAERAVVGQRRVGDVELAGHQLVQFALRDDGLAAAALNERRAPVLVAGRALPALGASWVLLPETSASTVASSALSFVPRCRAMASSWSAVSRLMASEHSCALTDEANRPSARRAREAADEVFICMYPVWWLEFYRGATAVSSRQS